MKILLLSIFTIAMFCAVTIYQVRNDDTSIIEAARMDLNATLIESEIGATRYQLFGEKNVSTIILIHSFNGFLESWAPNINPLVNAGYRVVAYDLFGRGLSDRPDVNYDLTLFRDQLSSVLREVGSTNVHLVGSSFGAVIASDYAHHHPNIVESLVLVGPAGWPSDSGRNPLLDMPLLGDIVFHYFGESILKPKVEAYFVDLSSHYRMVEEWVTYAQYPGFMRSALSTLRHSPVLDNTKGWQKLSELEKPTLFIWGTEDVSFPFSNTTKAQAIIPHAKIIGIDNAAHWVNIEQASQVNEAIISFVDKR